jgi:ABC-type polysaccharide transport system permease subunit
MKKESTLVIRKHDKKNWSLFFIALPFMLLLIMFQYVPIAGWVISFFDYKPGRPLTAESFIGLKYFKIIFTDIDILSALKNTLTFTGIGYLLSPLPMIVAILLNEISNKRFRKTAQTLTTLPHFIGWVIVYSLAYAIFSSEGIVNTILSQLGVDSQTSMLTNKDAVYAFQTCIRQWKHLGWDTIIYVAAISGIDQELYEAASIDGAGRFKRALHITIPSLLPTFIVLFIIGIGNFVNTGYEQYYIFKNPIVANNIEVLDLYIYRMGLQLQDYSYATAVGMVKSLISIVMVLSVNKLAKRIRGSAII